MRMLCCKKLPAFIVDDMLGKLAKWLRILGYDVVYAAKFEDAKIVNQALTENRIILTRDRQLLERRSLGEHLFIESDDYLEQLRQVVGVFQLRPADGSLFSRCLICNSLIRSFPRKRAEGRVPPYVWRTQKKFFYCRKCDKIYWAGTHIQNTAQALEKLSEARS